MQIIKYLTAFGLGAAGSAAWAADKAAQETVEHMPEFWSEVQEHAVNADVPQLLGYPSDPSLTMTYNPDAVSSGYLGFLQASTTIANFIFAAVVLVAVLFAVFVMINGRAKLEHGFSGKLIPRWSKLDVFLHWLTGIPGVVLILTGLVIGAGRFWLEPAMSPSHFFTLVSGSVQLHNFFAFPFLIGAVIMMVKWMKRQMPEKGDAAWFAKLGGYINLGKTKAEHPAAGFANAGEKAFFWTFVVFGLCLIVTGLMMLYPAAFGGVSKNSALLALIIHIVSAIVLSAFSVVHIYMGAVMSEGGIENMLSGKCDENWAIQNHSLWYEKVAKGN
ncbi:formate dehydrogenase subunit gamma [Mesosutterella sp. OilRF-GAM-744-9]|uniref:Formate dehydrogenase subunit gamma n=1 Tax=Mesosutterella porci TaxID=2915351 RepID=A0ABS9MPU4_9BURK|nr:formate dehydrogenase subunit gamma [Mesosutterella sp. oilRF-744-WT-GAM-9]MCG5030633.1 formate dehydrogenase subunit gamma [Mesosutterella sp. oilRF-744-WT-GAM-9]MCI6530596.1 formate dehydrogenase subunit gamma [Mesosutterella sp.]